MDGILRLSVEALAYNDAGSTSNPARRFFDWNRVLTRASTNPGGLPYTIQPGSSLTIFDGTRATGIGAATEFALSASTIPDSVGRYRFTWTSVGQNPALRTDRALALNGRTLTWTANANLTATVTSSGAGDFAAVVVGDEVYVPSTATGDALYPGDQLNVGRWLVIGKDGTSTTLQLQRPSGVTWSGASEAVVLTSNAQVVAYSAAGVQIGDGVSLSAGFSTPVTGMYQVIAVGPKHFEVQTSKQLPVSATAVPGTAGITFFTNLRNFILVEVNQDAHVQLNGDAGSGVAVGPIAAGDSELPGPLIKFGPCWKLVVVNDSLSTLDAYVATSE